MIAPSWYQSAGHTNKALDTYFYGLTVNSRPYGFLPRTLLPPGQVGSPPNLRQIVMVRQADGSYRAGLNSAEEIGLRPSSMSDSLTGRGPSFRTFETHLLPGRADQAMQSSIVSYETLA
jgi:hypothetical protein